MAVWTRLSFRSKLQVCQEFINLVTLRVTLVGEAEETEVEAVHKFTLISIWVWHRYTLYTLVGPDQATVTRLRHQAASSIIQLTCQTAYILGILSFNNCNQCWISRVKIIFTLSMFFKYRSLSHLTVPNAGSQRPPSAPLSPSPVALKIKSEPISPPREAMASLQVDILFIAFFETSFIHIYNYF